jgi:hypothetical protein
LPPGKDEQERRPNETLKRRGGIVRCRREAHERTLGEIPAKVFVVGPKRRKPKGAASGRRAKHRSLARDSWKGQSPETAASRAGPTPAGVWYIGLPTVSGSFQFEMDWIPFERGRLRRVNPMSAAGMKQGRHGFAGSKPSRG